MILRHNCQWTRLHIKIDLIIILIYNNGIKSYLLTIIHLNYSLTDHMRFVFIFILLALVQVHQANRFSYNRVLSCDNVTVIDSVNNISKCIKWSEETTIKYFYGNLFSYCFSEGTYVMTAEGPKAMRELGPED